MNKTNDKNLIFLYSYIINSLIVLAIKITLCIFEENIIGDVVINTITSLIFASPWNTNGFLLAKIDGVGPLAILMISFISSNLLYYMCNIQSNFKKSKKIIISLSIIILSCIVFMLFHVVLEINLPFCLLESLVASSVLLLISQLGINMSEKICNIIVKVFIILVSICSYVYLFLGYFIDA